jgi:hypothetical protein
VPALVELPALPALRRDVSVMSELVPFSKWVRV